MADGLSKYRSMRDFKSTPEPHGKAKKSKTGNLYIIQKHDATRLHYDFRLELDGVLLSWAVTRGPSLNPEDKRLAIHTEDHPIEYGGFEGVIPKGYGAGTVMLWDRGVWAPQGDPYEGLKKGNFKFVLMGERLKGGFALVRLKPKPGETSKNEPWLLIKERDQWADDSVVATEEWETSVKSGRDLDRIETQGEKYKRGKAYSPVAKTRAKSTAAKAAKAAVSLARKATAKPKRATAKAKGAAKRSPGKKPHPKGKPLDGPRAAPRFIEPQLATLEPAPPQGSEWLHEIKFDGYRIITVIKDGKVTLFTRNHLDWTHKYGRIREALEQLGLKDAVLDGELVAHDKSGKAAFSLMHAAVEDENIPLIYTLFDLLNDGGHDIRKLPLTARKERLKQLLVNPPDIIRYSDHIGGKGEAVIAQACRLDLEGVISKKADAPYISGRGLSWIKSKCIGSDEFVIGGYRLSDKQGRAFRSLLLGEFMDGKLIYRGRVGTGFNDETFRTLMPMFKRLQVKTSPFEDTPADARRSAVWVKPQIVAQVAYLEVTPDGHLRHPSYLGLREDKPAKAVKTGSSTVSLADRKATKGKSRVQAAAVKTARKVAPKPVAKPVAKAAKKSGPTKLGALRLTSPDKLLWADAGVTKLDLARFYHDMAKHILPHVKDRPLSLVRCPEGYEGECFFQKHHNPSTPDAIDTVKIREKDGKSNDYLVIRDAAGVVGAAQIGGLELHVWGSRTDSLEKPERIVFDLDPDEGLDFGDVKKAAVELRDVLESVGLKSFPMLTGGKGVHVIVPIARTQEWPQVKAFASGLARKLAAHSPDKYLAQASKAKRKGRIFIDWLRNERGATAVAPFSPRRRKGAPVATPVSWQELSKFGSAAAFTMATIEARLSRLKVDPWKGYAQAGRQALKAAAIEAVSED